MPSTLESSRAALYSPSFAKTDQGVLLIHDGVNAARRWDGLTAALEVSGITEPASACTIAGSGTGSLSGTYTAYVRFVDDEGQVSSLSPVSNEVTISGKAQVDYTSVPTGPTRTAKRQLFRNLDGNADVYYLDTEISDNATTTATGTKTDTQLAAQTTFVRLISQNGDEVDDSLGPNRHTPPPSHRAVVVNYQNRAWYAVEREIPVHVSLTNASAAVTGIQTNFTSIMVGWELHLVGVTTPLILTSVTNATSATLTANFGGTTGVYYVGSIRPPSQYRNLVYFSSLGEPESVFWDDDADPEIGNAVEMQEDNDELTALALFDRFLYVAKRRHLYVLACDNCDPRNSINIRLVANRGLVNHRTWCGVNGGALAMDYEGVYAVSAGAIQERISDPIQDVFRERIYWPRAEWFFAVSDATRSLAKFFVCLDGSRRPRHALVYNYRWNTWAIEEYYHELGGADDVTRARPIRVLAGGEHAKVWWMDDRPADAPASNQTMQGTATSWTRCSLSDSAATWSSALVGHHVAITHGRGKHQVRRIVAVSGTTLRLDRSWNVQPDTTSRYAIGGIGYSFKTGKYRYARREVEQSRKVRLYYRPTASYEAFDLRAYLDRDQEPTSPQIDAAGLYGGIVTTERNKPDVRVNMQSAVRTGTTNSGYASYAYDDATEDDESASARLVQIEVKGWQSQSPVRVSGITIEGAG